MKPFTATAKKAVNTPPKAYPLDLRAAPGMVVNDGKTIEWGSTNAVDLTPGEIAELKRRRCNIEKARHIKALMPFKTCAEIVKHFSRTTGYGERTVKGIHAALSVGEGLKSKPGAICTAKRLTY